MSKRKTIEVSKMLKWANTQLARTDEFANQSFKSGIAVMIEELLMKSGNYNGWGYLTQYDFQNRLEYNRFYYGK